MAKCKMGMRSALALLETSRKRGQGLSLHRMMCRETSSSLLVETLMDKIVMVGLSGSW